LTGIGNVLAIDSYFEARRQLQFIDRQSKAWRADDDNNDDDGDDAAYDDGAAL